ncbi:MAG: exodeoxyribonuclease VII small subunit [Alphaproteobacteria bacterium]|nr:exodeoxyribonuclease VII small subunit [Alphaproteobacteria bacterium]
MAARTAHPPPPADTPVADTPVVGNPVADVATLSFEEALAELERIVRALEGGQQKLEDAIGAYERGAKLKAHCEAKLAEAEQRVQAIVAGADGSLSLRSAE